MVTTNLRKVGGSVMLAVPPAILDLLNLAPGTRVGLNVADGRLVVAPLPPARYTLDELLAQCDQSAPADEECAWLESPALGNELL